MSFEPDVAFTYCFEYFARDVGLRLCYGSCLEIELLYIYPRSLRFNRLVGWFGGLTVAAAEIGGRVG